mmetsp:Transcript_5716/g.19988  ORF Transcript_5716/g.19988 Transcript_5716/m.19988 type:complete len:350 (+) Transcript_5716:406-1455(+)
MKPSSLPWHHGMRFVWPLALFANLLPAVLLEAIFPTVPVELPTRLQRASWEIATNYFGSIDSFTPDTYHNTIRPFYHQCYAAEVSHVAKAIYIRTPKCANAAVVSNMKSSTSFSDGTFAATSGVEQPVSGVETLSCSLVRHYLNQGYSAFTTTRQPIKRFLSAYKEVVMREYNICAHNRPLCSQEYHALFLNPLGSPEHFLEFIIYLLEGKLLPVSSQIFHAFAQAGFFHAFAQPGLFHEMQEICALRVETIREGWLDFQYLLGTDPFVWKESYTHPAEFMGVSHAAKGVTISNKNVTRAICAIYMVDFVAFRYQMPIECREEEMLRQLNKKWLQAMRGNARSKNLSAC